jgi:hypothetical protein
MDREQCALDLRGYWHRLGGIHPRVGREGLPRAPIASEWQSFAEYPDWPRRSEMIELTKQTQATGNHSTAIQATNVTIIQQADRRHIEAIAREVIRRELDTLTAKAASTFQARADELIRDFIETLSDARNFNIAKAEDPRFQFALRDAQREFGKSGSPQLKDALIALLVRIGSEPNDELAKLYAEAIKMMPLLTRPQINAISLVCAVRLLTFDSAENVQQLTDDYRTKAFPFLDGIARLPYDFSHIEYARCGQVGTYEFSLVGVIRNNYSGLFWKGTSSHLISAEIGDVARQALLKPCPDDESFVRVNATNAAVLERRIRKNNLTTGEAVMLHILFEGQTMPDDEIMATLGRADIRFRQLADYIAQTDARHLSLTSVGQIIAIVNIEHLSGEKIDLSKWLSG